MAPRRFKADPLLKSSETESQPFIFFGRRFSTQPTFENVNVCAAYVAQAALHYPIYPALDVEAVLQQSIQEDAQAETDAAQIAAGGQNLSRKNPLPIPDGVGKISTFSMT